MSFDPERLTHLVAAHGTVWRVLVLEAAGSVPRGAGTAMWVWDGGQEGTIGGGRLEWEAAALARADHLGLHRLPLGPGLGQCCGGAVTLYLSRWTGGDAPVIDGQTCVYGPNAGLAATPARLPHHAGGRVHEALQTEGFPLYIWGAGHVGRALVTLLDQIPSVAVHWVDLAQKLPDTIAPSVTVIPTDAPERIAAHVPRSSANLILTHSHDTDLALCHALLTRGVARIGLIGSSTKWARFRSRLQQMGHGIAELDTIQCPIGDPSLGKRPQAIAIGVAADILRAMEQAST